MKKRIAIFVFYDKDNIVDEYVYFLLGEIKKVVGYLTVVCNGHLSEKDYQRIQKYADDVFERENIGYDAGAIKDVILDYVGVEKIKEYEELLITNDTIYGPLYPLSEVFRKMESEDVDFWGLTQVEESDHSPNYLQSYFLVVRSRLLHSEDFVHYWKRMQYCTKFDDVLYFYEERFTGFFAERGYRWNSYVDTSAYSYKGQKNVPNPYYHIFEESMSGRNKLPFIKRKPLISKKESQGSHSGILFESYIRTLRECANGQYFDFNMVWDNLLRIYPLEDIQKGCHLTYLFPSGEIETNHMDDTLILVIVRSGTFFPEMMEQCKVLTEAANVWIAALDSFALPDNQYLEEQGSIRFMSMRSEKELFAYVAEVVDRYRYICCIDTEDFENKNKIYTEQKACFLCCFENLVKNNPYVFRIHSTLEKEKRLGMLFPPQMLEEQILPNYVFYGGMHSFWIKGEIFYSFFENVEAEIDKPIGEVLAGYAKTEGYYAGIVKNDKYAVVDSAMKEEYLIEIIDNLGQLYGEASFYVQKGRLTDWIMIKKKLEPWIKRHKRVYIYGTGDIAHTLAPMLPKPEGFIVSDGHPKDEFLYGVPIICFSKYKYESGDGIILALNHKNARQVLGLFEEHKLAADVWAYQL